MTSRPIAGHARAWLGSLAILALMLAPWTPSAGAASEAVVSGTGDLGLWLKAAPDFAADRVALLAEGTTLQVLEGPQPGGNDRAWARVRAGDDTGWVVTDFLAFTDDAPPPGAPDGPAPGGWARVTGTRPTTGLRLRAAPAPWEALLKILPEDTVIHLVEGPATGGNGNPWYRVEATGTTGWVDGSYLVAADAPAAPAEPARRTGSAAVAVALRHIGKPYAWGGNGPDSFDCSGFTVYVARHALGIALPRTSQQQAFAGFHVDRQDLLPGDLVFFGDTYEPGVTHVGFYIGNNQWISAQDESTGVVVGSLDDRYWGAHYFGARRIT